MSVAHWVCVFPLLIFSFRVEHIAYGGEWLLQCYVCHNSTNSEDFCTILHPMWFYLFIYLTFHSSPFSLLCLLLKDKQGFSVVECKTYFSALCLHGTLGTRLSSVKVFLLLWKRAVVLCFCFGSRPAITGCDYSVYSSSYGDWFGKRHTKQTRSSTVVHHLGICKYNGCHDAQRSPLWGQGERSSKHT